MRHLSLFLVGAVSIGAALAQSSPQTPTKPQWTKGISLAPEGHPFNLLDARDAGVKFAYIAASSWIMRRELMRGYTEPRFAATRNEARAMGMITGAYFVADPSDRFTSTQQATYFVRHGGGDWEPDGQTLPGAVLLPRPIDACFGLTVAQFRHWVWDFFQTYFILAARMPTIMVDPVTWHHCTGGNWFELSPTALWILSPGGSEPMLPASWDTWTFWSYASGCQEHANCPGWLEYFNGPLSALQAFATRHDDYSAFLNAPVPDKAKDPGLQSLTNLPRPPIPEIQNASPDPRPGPSWATDAPQPGPSWATDPPLRSVTPGPVHGVAMEGGTEKVKSKVWPLPMPHDESRCASCPPNRWQRMYDELRRKREAFISDGVLDCPEFEEGPEEMGYEWAKTLRTKLGFVPEVISV